MTHEEVHGGDASTAHGDLRTGWTATGIRVRYAETDAMGVAHHASYLAWLEVGRTEWIRRPPGLAQDAAGDHAADAERSYRTLERAGFLLPVLEVSCRYLASARYDDALVVRTRLSEATRARMAFDYEVVRGRDGRPLATGRTLHAVTDAAGRPRRMPKDLLAWVLGEPGGIAPELPGQGTR